jgi:hypothetical protein
MATKRNRKAASGARPASEVVAFQRKRRRTEEDPALAREVAISRRRSEFGNDTPETAPEDPVAPMPGKRK